MAIFGFAAGSLIVAIALSYLWRTALYPYLFSPIRHIPYARTDWPTALYRWIYAEPDPPRVLRWVEQSPNNGLLRYPGVGGSERVLLLDAVPIKETLVTNCYTSYQRPPINRERLEAIFGNGLVVAEGQTHRLQRRKMQPAFAPKHIRELHPVFWAKACEMLQLISDRVNKERHVSQKSTATVELVTFTQRAALDVIGIAAFGKDYNSLSNPHSDFVHRYHTFQVGSPTSNAQAKIIHTAALVIPMKTLARLFPCEFFRNIRMGSLAVREACKERIAEKRTQLEKGAQGFDILGHAMSSEHFSDEELVGQMKTILGAGHNTTSRATTFACYLLAKHPSAQEKLREEIRCHLPSPFVNDNTVSADLMDRLPFLRATISEVLRLVPIVPLLRRETMKPTTLMGQYIPAGINVIPMAWVTNVSTKLWGPDAKEFIPERWLSSESPATAPQAYLSFSTGPRSCIGEGFARAELASLIAVLVGRFDLRLSSPADGFPSCLWGPSIVPLNLKFELSEIPGW